MAELEVLTVTYAPDRALFEILQESIQRFTSSSVIHRVVVDDQDLSSFSQFAGPRCEVIRVSDVLPRSFVKVPGKNLYVNLRRPWPPVRGWIFQQLIKLLMVARSEADLVLLMDSDVALVSDVDATSFSSAGVPDYFRSPGAVHGGMKRHLIWHDEARSMLGLGPAGPPPFPDYVDSFNIWSPTLVRDMTKRMETVAHRPWTSTFASKIHVSEFILYGVYVDAFVDEKRVHPVARMNCHNYWDETPLDRPGALDFARGIDPNDVAMMISAKSRTDVDVQRAAWEAAVDEAARHR